MKRTTLLVTVGVSVPALLAVVVRKGGGMMVIPNRGRVVAVLFALALVGGLLTLAVLVKPAWADDTLCVGTLPPGTYDNVVAPEGTSCNLTDSIVRGNVTALEGSTLVVFRDEVGGTVKVLEGATVVMSDNEVRGNVVGDKADAVQVTRGTVGGNIHIVGANVPGPLGPVGALVNGTLLPEGNIQIEKNTTLGVLIFNATLTKGNVKVEKNVVNSPSFGLQIQGNQVGGNMQVFKNSGPAEKRVQGNIIRENLQCFKNTPPFIGSPNVAQKAEGQCTAEPAPAAPAAPGDEDKSALPEGSDGGAATPLGETTAP
jgi:hypothetical protein